MSEAGVQTAAAQAPLLRDSFIELSARERARALLDAGSFRELLGPFDHIESPWLPLQGVVCQADDGVVIARGSIDGEPAVVAAIESAFQGGSIGEVSGSKIAAALELALADCERGRIVRPVVLFETGGVRLQEANLGLAVISEIQSAIVALRRYVPVVGVIAGMVGCFGGMSLAAALCSSLVITKQGRLGMNGPEVIEQEAGIEELDSSDRRHVWQLIGGAQRAATGLADVLVDDDAHAMRDAVRAAFARGLDGTPRSAQVEAYLARLAQIDPATVTPESMRAVFRGGESARAGDPPAQTPQAAQIIEPDTRGAHWFRALAGESATSAPVWSADAPLGDERARFIAVVPDAGNRFPRATTNVVGLEQGWRLAQAVREAIAEDAARDVRRPIVAVVDVKSQAYGYREEMLGIHLACAAAVDAYASARQAGHPVVALIVGPAMSGAFLAHGYQGNRIVALDAPGTMVHAMGKEAAARVTRRTVEALDALGETIVPMSYSMASFAKLGLLDRLIDGVDADAPNDTQIERVRSVLVEMVREVRGVRERGAGSRDLSHRLQSETAKKTRAASIEVRRRLAEQWNEA
ncbi:biotin-independent malonate decarboxylase subunit beta [Paraburkholderia sp. A1RI_3L]